MAIPDYQMCMLHLLELAGDGQEHALKDAFSKLATTFQLTDAESGAKNRGRVYTKDSAEKPRFLKVMIGRGG
jgi:restriction endonuclease Mrr